MKCVSLVIFPFERKIEVEIQRVSLDCLPTCSLCLLKHVCGLHFLNATKHNLSASLTVYHQAPRQSEMGKLRQDWSCFTPLSPPHLRDTQVLIDGLYWERGGEKMSLKSSNTFPVSQSFVTQKPISLGLTTQRASPIHMKKRSTQQDKHFGLL